MLPGIVGTVQATEAIKVLLDLGETLSGKLLTFDTLTMDFRTLRIYRDEDCPVCEAFKPEVESGDRQPARVGA